MSASPRESNAQPITTAFNEDDLAEAWRLISPDGQSALTKSEVFENLRIFFPQLSAQTVRDLVGSGNLTFEKLKKILFESEVPTFDANVEAFRLVDPHGTGYIDGSVLARLVVQLPDIEYIDEDDLKAIMRIADADNDGRISMKDFATIGSWMPSDFK